MSLLDVNFIFWHRDWILRPDQPELEFVFIKQSVFSFGKALQDKYNKNKLRP